MTRLIWILMIALVMLSLAPPGFGGPADDLNELDPLPVESCPGVIFSTPDLSMCFAPGLLRGSEVGLLGEIECVVAKINKWGAQGLACLQAGIERRQRLMLYKDKLLAPLRELQKVTKHVKPLKLEIERLACGWRFSPRTDVLRGLYLKPLKLCKPAMRLVFGSHDSFWDADVQQLLEWTSTTTHNIIQERTVGDLPGAGGKSPPGPEDSWQRIAAAGALGLETHLKTPGHAVRYAAQLSADNLQVRNNTLQMGAQGLLVEQQARDYRTLKRNAERALGVTALAGGLSAARTLGRRVEPPLSLPLGW